MRVSELRVHPVKSCRGDLVESAVVEPWGLAGDRRWMVVDSDGQVVTAREVPRLLLVHPVITPTGLRVTAPGLEPLVVATPAGATTPVAVWRDRLRATPADAEAARWFSAAAGRAVRLVFLDDPTRRPTDPAFAPGGVVSFADGYPLLLTTEASLTALADAAIEAAQEVVELTMTRFRPNLVVAGAEAWAEDGWRRIRVGEAVFRAVKGCARCVMTTVDPDTAEKGSEPLRTLARTRRWDGRTWFGVNLVPETPGAAVRVGDEVEVDSTGPTGD